MKVTLLIAMCTLVVLLQQMQTPLAKPLDLGPLVELNDICELILPFHSIETTMVGTYQNYFYRLHDYMKFLLLSYNYMVIIIITYFAFSPCFHLVECYYGTTCGGLPQTVFNPADCCNRSGLNSFRSVGNAKCFPW